LFLSNEDGGIPKLSTKEIKNKINYFEWFNLEIDNSKINDGIRLLGYSDSCLYSGTKEITNWNKEGSIVNSGVNKFLCANFLNCIFAV
jgi:hypothetical protein